MVIVKKELYKKCEVCAEINEFCVIEFVTFRSLFSVSTCPLAR